MSIPVAGHPRGRAGDLRPIPWWRPERGVGDDIDAAVRNGWTDEALYSDYIGDGFDGYMDFEELGVHLHGLLEFPADLVVENERPRV
jgi:hypothetical protein